MQRVQFLMYKRQHISIIILAIFITFIPFQPVHSDNVTKDMQVHFINVGQGDSIYIRTPSNKHILIDGGPPKYGKKVVNYLKQQGVKKLDLVVATHPDIDHIGGLVTVMKQLEIKKMLDSGKLHTTKRYSKYIQELVKQEIPISIAKMDEEIELDPLLNIQVLNTYQPSRSNNQSSIVLQVSYKQVDFLFMGDVEMEQEKDIRKKVDAPVEILKVAHHGSKTSSSLSFLQSIQPNIAILTYHKNNRYGHPVERVIHHLYKVGASIYSTGALGHLVIRTDGTTYIVEPEKEPYDALYAS